MLSRDEVVAICDTYCLAISNRDIETILALFTEDGCATNGAERHVGQVELRKFYSGDPETKLSVTRIGPVTVQGKQAAMQVGVEVVRGAETAFVVVTDILELSDDGRISSIEGISDPYAQPEGAG